MTLAGGNVTYITPNHGYVEYAQPANPGAGLGYNWQPPSGWAYRFFNIWVTLTTAVAPANRALQISFSSGSNIIWRTGVAAANYQTASLVWGYCFATTHGDFETRRTAAILAPITEVVSLPLAEIVLLGGGGAYFDLAITNLQAADQVSQIQLGFNRWQI